MYDKHAFLPPMTQEQADQFNAIKTRILDSSDTRKERTSRYISLLEIIMTPTDADTLLMILEAFDEVLNEEETT